MLKGLIEAFFNFILQIFLNYLALQKLYISPEKIKILNGCITTNCRYGRALCLTWH